MDVTKRALARTFGLAWTLLVLPAVVFATDDIAIATRHAPAINGNARVEGSVQQLLDEDVTLNGGATLTHDYVVPGTPNVIANGNVTWQGIQAGSGNSLPAGYTVRLNGGATLRHVRTRTNPSTIPSVPSPAPGSGTRSVTLNQAGQSVGTWTTVRDLTLNGNAGVVAVPAGAYRNFTAGGGSHFKLGVAGETQPSTYSFQSLTLNGQSTIQVVGPVILHLANGFNANGLTGVAAHPEWLQIRIATGGVTLNGGATMHGSILAPSGHVMINGQATLCGTAMCDRFTLNGGGVVRWTVTSGGAGNQPPVANTQSIAAIEDTASVISLTGSDPDEASLTFTVTAQPQHGSLSGAAPTVTYLPDANYFGADSFSFIASDGTAVSASAVVSINVAARNDPPVAQPQSVTLSEDSAADLELMGTDVDGDPLTFLIVNGPQHGALTGTIPHLRYTPVADYNGPDQFVFKVNDGRVDSSSVSVPITVRPEADVPVAAAFAVTVPEDQWANVTLTGTDRDGDALRFTVIEQPQHGVLSGTSPNLVYTPTADYSGPDSFRYVAQDASATSAFAIVTINVTRREDAPIASDLPVAMDEDQEISFKLPASDADGDALSFEITAAPQYGTIGGTAPNLVYTPVRNFVGSDTLTFIARDALLSSAPAVVRFTIRNVNDAPVAQTQAITSSEDITAPVILSGSDVDGDPLVYTLITLPEHGTLGGSAPNLTYTPEANYFGSDAFSFLVNDGTVDSAVAPVTLAIGTVNDVPVAVPLAPTSPEDQPFTVTLGGIDVDGFDLEFAIVEQPQHGVLTVVGAEVTYTPVQDYFGDDHFRYVASDPYSDSAPAEVAITITPVNDAPTATPQQLIVAEDEVRTVTLAGVDVESDPLSYRILTAPAHGTLTPVAQSVFRYQPAPDYNGPDGFAFVANDGQDDSRSATVSIIVEGRDDAPVAQPAALVTAEDTPLGIVLTAVDPDGEPLFFEVVAPPAHGSLSGFAPNLTYLPAQDFHGPDSFRFRVMDGRSTTSEAAVALTVTPVNDLPDFRDQALAVAEDGEIVIPLGATDVDGDALTYRIVAAPLNGTVVLPFATLRYRPATNFHGNDSFRLQVEDGHGGSAGAQTSLTVTSVNDAPSAQPLSISVLEDASAGVPVAGADVDGDELTFAIVESPAHGQIIGTAPDFQYVPNRNFSGPDRFTYVSRDGVLQSAPAEVSVFVEGINDAPSGQSQNVAVDEDAQVQIALTGSDVENDPLTCSVVMSPAHGTLLGSAPNVTYVPTANYAGPDQFTFSVNDGQRTSAPSSVSIQVREVNDAPTVAIIEPVNGANVDGSEPITIRVAAADIDNLITELQLSADGILLTRASAAMLEFSWITAGSGAHVLTATAMDASGAAAAAQPVSLTVTQTPNGPVRVDAGSDVLLALPAEGSLAGTVTIDGAPAGAGLEVIWQVAGGPGPVTFENAASLQTHAAFTVPGEYHVRLTATAPEGTATDTVRITVKAAAEPGPEAPVSNAGREFWLAFLETPPPFFEPDHMGTFLLLDGRLSASGTVETFSNGFESGGGFANVYRRSFSLAAGGGTMIEAGRTPDGYDPSSWDRPRSTAVHVRSDQPINVVALNMSDYSTDAALILPTGLLGQEYFVMGYRNTESFHPSRSIVGSTQFAVVATENGTEVEITPTASSPVHPAGQPFTIVMQKGEVFRMRNQTDPEADFTGTEIHSSQPVAVFGGNSIALVPTRTAAGDHLYEQMPPVALWGTNFVTLPLKTRLNGDRFRFLAARDNTRVAVNGRIVATLRRGGFYETVLTEAAHIVADQPVLVGQFAHSSGFDNTTGDPFFMIVPPYEQFGRSYQLQTPTVHSYWGGGVVDLFDNYLSVIARAGHEGSVRLNGQPISPGEFQPIGDSGFVGASVAVAGSAPIDLVSAEPIGAWLYGWAEYESYGIMGGIYAAGSFPGLLELSQIASAEPIGAVHRVRARLLSASQMSVPGARIAFEVAGANPNSGVVTADADGVAEFTWTGAAAGTDTVTARSGTLVQTTTVLWLDGAPNAPPVVDAGPPLLANVGEPVPLAGSVQDDGAPAGQALTVVWEKMAGEGDVIFTPPTAPQSTAAFSEPGLYRVRLYASDGQFVGSDETTVLVNAPPRFEYASSSSQVLSASQAWSISFWAEDSDGRIIRAEILEGANVLSSADFSPDDPAGNSIFHSTEIALANVGLHHLTVRVTDNAGGTASIHFDVRVTLPPVVAIIEPGAFTQLRIGDSILFRAAASDPDGTIVSVEYTEPGSGYIFGVGTGPDFAFSYTPDYATDYEIIAVATDDAGITSYSEPVRFQVVQNSGVTIRLAAPTSGSTAVVGKTSPWRAEIDNPNGVAIDRVVFFNSMSSSLTDHSAPFEGTWLPVEQGPHRLSVRAYNSGGLVAVSEEVVVEVTHSLMLRLATPAPGARVPAGVPLRIEVESTDPYNLLRTYQLFVNGELVSESPAPTFEWTPTAPGPLTLRVDGVDRYWTSIPSGSVSIEALAWQPLVVRMTGPTDRTNVPLDGATTVQAVVDGGTPARLELLADGAVLAGNSEASLSFAWSGASGGWHEVVAAATDTLGQRVVSASRWIFFARPEREDLNAPGAPMVEVRSPTEILVTLPPVPGGLTLSAVALERKRHADGAWTEIAQLGLGEQTYVDADLEPETYYVYRLAYLTDSGSRSPWSPEAAETTQVELPRFAVLDVTQDLLDSGAIAQMALTDQTRRVAQIAPTGGAVPFPREELRPIGLSEEGWALLGGPPGQYVLWKPGEKEKKFERERFIAHRMTRHGKVVGSVELDSTTDAFARSLPHLLPVVYEPGLGDAAGTFKDLLPGNIPFRLQRDLPTHAKVGVAFELTPDLDELGFVTDLPTLHDAWDMNGSGRVAGAGMVYLRPQATDSGVGISDDDVRSRIEDSAGFSDSGKLLGYEASESVLMFVSQPSRRFASYTAHLNSAVSWVAPSGGAADVTWRWLGPIGVDNTRSAGLLINDEGTVAGIGGLRTGNEDVDAFAPTHTIRIAAGAAEFDRLTPVVTDLGVLPGGLHSGPNGMNAGGEIVGHSEFDVVQNGAVDLFALTQNHHAAYWGPAATEPEDLGSLGAVPELGFPNGYSVAKGINKHGLIVGDSILPAYNTTTLTSGSSCTCSTPSGRLIVIEHPPATVGTLWRKNRNLGAPAGQGNLWELDNLNNRFNTPNFHLLRTVGINDLGYILGRADFAVINAQDQFVEWQTRSVMLIPVQVDLTPDKVNSGLQTVTLRAKVQRFDAMTGELEIVPDGARVTFIITATDGSETTIPGMVVAGYAEVQFDREPTMNYEVTVDVIEAELAGKKVTFKPGVVRDASKVSWKGLHFPMPITDASGTRYLKLGLDGWPQPDERPQVHAEQSAEPEETFIDALNLHLHHSVTDVFIPMVGGELSLAVRRTLAPEVWQSHQGLWPWERPDRPFGVNWRATLAASIEFVCQNVVNGNFDVEADYAHVTDEQGAQYRFLMMGANFYPLPESDHEIEVYESTLRRENGGFVFTKKNGSVYRFENTSLSFQLPSNRIHPERSGQSGTGHKFARATEITDRYGSKLIYTYYGPGTLIPGSISTDLGQTIWIDAANGRVRNIWDPLGRRTRFVYEEREYSHPEVYGSFQTLVRVERPTDQLTPASNTQYRYEFAQEKDTVPPIEEEFAYQTNLAAITDGAGNTHEFGYEWDHSRKVYVPTQGHFIQIGVPRYVAMSRLPAGLGTARFVNESSMRFDTVDNPQFNGYRHTRITDAMGGVHTYNFTGNKVVRLNAVKQLYTNLRSIPDWLLPHMVVFTQMDVTRAGLGSESYHFNLEAGMRPDSVRDLSGNVTRFEYGDPFTYTDYHPGLTGDFPVVRYPEPTAQIDALGNRKTFTYGPYRQMATMVDEEGRRTEHGFGPQGQRTSEAIYAPGSGLVQNATWNFGDGRFPAFPTASTRSEANPATGAAPLVTEWTADDYGRVASEVRDAAGSRWTVRHTYDDASQRISTTDGRDQVTHFIYDAQNRLRQVEYPPADGNLENATFRDYFYDQRGLKIQEVDENENATLWLHDALGRVIADGHDMDRNGVLEIGEPLTQRNYNAVGSVTDVYDALGHRTHTDYDALQRPRVVTDPLGATTQLAYGANSGGAIWDSSGFHPTLTTDRRGFRTERQYDARYRPRVERQEYEPGVWAERTFGYDRAGNLVAETDPRGNPTTHTFDALNRRTTTRFADATTQSWRYGPSGEAVSATDERGFTSETHRDGAGRPVTTLGPVVEGGRPETATTYDAAGNVAETRVKIDATRVRGTTWTYDGRNRRIEEQRADATTLGWTYDGAGRLRAERDARGAITERTYDAADRPVRVISPAVALPEGGSAQPQSQNIYDAAGNILAVHALVRPGEVRSIFNNYDVLNRLAATTDAADQTTTYAYDAEGHRQTVTDARNHHTSFRHDGLGRVTTETDHLGRATAHQFDGAVETQRTDAESRVTSYGYDARLRLRTATYAGRPADNRAYAYDAAGLLTSVNVTGYDALCDVGYAYDALGRVTAESSAALTHAYHYDFVGQRVRSIQGGTGRQVVSSFDLLGRLLSLSEGGRVTSYGYDENGNPTRQTLPGAGGVITRAYDALNRVQSIASPGYSAAHGYTLTGELVRLEETHPAQSALNRTVVNGYDAIGRLTSETVTGAGVGLTTYAYDAANNRTRRTQNGSVTSYTYNVLNQLSAHSNPAGSATYSYDLDGNRTGRTSNLPDQPSATYNYDHEHRLVGVATTLSGQPSLLSYLYDYRTRRVGRTEPGQSTAVVFSGGLSIAEYPTGASTPSVEFQRGPDLGGGVAGLLYSLHGNQPSYSYANHRGDIVSRRDAAGATTWGAAYEAFGERPLELGVDPDRQRANSKEEDPTGLLNEGFRYRDLATGTFLTRDPAGFIDGPNLYAYCGQNPWSGFDPEGLFEWGYMFRGMVKDVFGIGGVGDRFGQGVMEAGRIGSDMWGTAYCATSDKVFGTDTMAHYEGSSQLYQRLAANPEKYNVDKLRDDIVLGGVKAEANVLTFGGYSYVEGAVSGNWEEAQDAAFGTAVGSATARVLPGKPRGVKGGEREGMDMTPRGKRLVIAASRAKYGTPTCEDCKVATTPATQSKRGVTPARTETRVDHVYPKSKGGDGSPANAEVRCLDCNGRKSDTILRKPNLPIGVEVSARKQREQYE